MWSNIIGIPIPRLSYNSFFYSWFIFIWVSKSHVSYFAVCLLGLLIINSSLLFFLFSWCLFVKEKVLSCRIFCSLIIASCIPWLCTVPYISCKLTGFESLIRFSFNFLAKKCSIIDALPLMPVWLTFCDVQISSESIHYKFSFHNHLINGWKIIF